VLGDGRTLLLHMKLQTHKTEYGKNTHFDLSGYNEANEDGSHSCSSGLPSI